MKNFKDSVAIPETPTGTVIVADDLSEAFRKCASIENIENRFNTKEKKWKGCEAVMYIVCEAATMKSVESVVES